MPASLEKMPRAMPKRIAPQTEMCIRDRICKVHADIENGLPIRLFKSDNPQYGDGESFRDFVYVKDCVEVLYWLLQHPGANGILNIGSGKARTWNDLAHAVYAAMELPPKIDYFDMPENLKGKYQYFTESEMGWLQKYGCDVKFHTLEEGTADYVRNYLMKDCLLYTSGSKR